MSMASLLEIGKAYERPELVRLWGLGGFQAISRGVYAPRGQNAIFLFVTREKQDCLTQYNDFMEGDLLFWEGEQGHGSDRRIADASTNGEDICLFYRDRHHSPFTYNGKVVLTHCLRHEDRPSEFVFKIAAYAADVAVTTDENLAEAQDDYLVLGAQPLSSADRQIIARSRGIAQRVFRGNLFRLWNGACAVTGVREPLALKACHVKPLAVANTEEKIDPFNGILLVPNLDALLTKGLISFREDGTVMVSSHWAADDQRLMHVTPDLHLRQAFREAQPYLAYHRECCFRR